MDGSVPDREYQFRLLVRAPTVGGISDDDLLDATDALGNAGCGDCSIGVRGQRLELEFERTERSVRDAIASAGRDVEAADLTVESVEIDCIAGRPAHTISRLA